ncbi:HDOD domain-containing protein [Pokkaliibacter sp. MBI-7]|uniref:HDOD domain-containing protein n=1 Tax=Pokkaliibacter sp. MBI-7 TaxID=3040600 RepID=UPI002446BF1D|nr:HDOD domain-containing protein [Pokkaliibacter sp. MBI-7]MDH2432230.1 HDOD domain-containing protein [Pokkaliibacter sp. MBI-7]
MSDSPYGAEQWVEFLADKPLPIMAHSRQFLLHQLRRPDVALMELAPALQADPVLSLHLLRHANQLNNNQETDIRTLDHALSSLGLQRIREVLDNAPVLQMNNQSVAHRQYLYAVANSLHAAFQARDWAKQLRPTQIAQLYAAGMLYGFIHWSLWRFAPDAISQVHGLIHEQQLDPILAESNVLGCPAQAIAHGLALRWQLPEVLVNALDMENASDKRLLSSLHRRARGDELNPDQERMLNHLVHAPWMLAKMANWVAHTAHFGWYGQGMDRLMPIIGDVLRLTREEASARCHRTAVIAAAAYATPGIIAPASRLIMAPDDQPIAYRMPHQQGNRTVTARPQAQQRMLPGKLFDERHYQDRLFQLNNADKQLSSLGAIMQGLLEGMHDGIGLQRCAILMTSQDSKEIAGRLAAGDSGVEAFKHFRQSLHTASIFQRLCSQPGSLWVNDKNRDKVQSLLPEAFQSLCHPQEFFMMSIFLGKRPIAVVYADAGLHGDVRPMHYNAFRQLVQAANRGVTLYYRARQQMRS